MAASKDVQFNYDRLDCLSFYGRSISLIHPLKRRLVGQLCRKTGGWWYGWRRKRRWITNMIQSEAIRSISRRTCCRSICTITHPPLIWLWFMFQQHTFSQEKTICHLFISKQWSAVQAVTSDRLFIVDNSRRLLVWRAVCPAVWGVCPLPGLACSRCVSRLHVLAMADLPAPGLGN